eukprot:CAMPEP_0203695560 /NCGR_PEP_ID=MMETSP0091-20130426/6994_2 /ASSEMBLY_ACC=CAM_ASM_001089 /TAXON_ID=426623 /ORGANISM="Chaetoceros affinis, Strain CCMP159" /LENGTH=78 /DNA_ID=CAMNT_0050567145 /DNA_START=525 /DNA_END=758 /DNA_ORIENTATION=-
MTLSISSRSSSFRNIPLNVQPRTTKYRAMRQAAAGCSGNTCAQTKPMKLLVARFSEPQAFLDSNSLSSARFVLSVSSN